MMLKLIQTTTALALLFSLAQPVQAQQSAHLFYEQLASLCGSSYVGEMTFPTDGQDSFKGKQLVAKFKECNEQQVFVPFSVGEDKSRTWVFTKAENGVTLKHDHRHDDGSPDEVTNYGGNSGTAGDALNQSFAADKFTQKLIPDAATNVWSISISEDLQQLTYHLERHNKPRFTAVLIRQNP